MPAIFVSHSSRDPAIAEDIRVWLKGLKFDEVFLDFDKHSGIGAGENWEKRLYEELARCHVVMLVLTPNWLESKWCHAELTIARALGKVVLPVICSPIDNARTVLPQVQAVDLIDWKQDGFDRIRLRLDEITNELARGFTLPANRSPYPGFLAFEAEDAAIYFGRDAETRAVIEQLDQRRTRGEPSFFVVIGASGAGKSSLLKAGVLPQLGRRPRDWLMLPTMRPERSPMEGLAKAIAHRLGKPDEWKKWRDNLGGADAARHWRELVSDLRIGDAAGATILIPIDQLEEMFTVADAGERASFLKSLAVALDPTARLPVVVLATGRSDVLDGVLDQASEELAQVTTTWLLAPMPLDRVPQLIEGPAGVAGLYLDAGLAERVAGHVETSEALPLLAHVLWQLHAKAGKDKRLTLKEYEALGDPERGLNPIQNSIRRAADEALAASKATDAQRAALRDAFVHLVSVRLEDSKRVRQLALEARLPKDSLPLIGALEQARLITRRASPEGVVVEVAHEALFKAWDTLDQWLTEEHDFLTDIERLKVAHEVWSRAPEDHKAKALLHGFLLSRARDWLEKYPNRFKSPRLKPIRSLIRASAAAEDAARVRAERGRRLVLYGSVAAAVIGLGLAVAAGWMAWRAVVAERQSASNFEGAAGAISTLVEAVPQKVEPVAPFGTVEALLAEATRAIDSLPSSAAANPRIDEYRAAISIASADLSYELARYCEMRRQAVRALGDYERVLVRDPGNLRARAGTARGWQQIGLSYKEMEEGSAGCSEERGGGTVDANKRALDAYFRAIRGFDALIAEQPEHADALRWKIQRADVFADLGDLHIQRLGDVPAAEQAFRRALDERVAIEPSVPADRKALLTHDIGWMHNKLADVHRELSHIDEALASFRRAEQMISSLGDTLQSNKHWLNHLMLVRNNVGLAWLAKGNISEAIAAFRLAMGDGAELARRYPENQYIASNVAWSYDNLGETLLRRGLQDETTSDLREAAATLTLAHEARQKFVAAKPLWARDQIFTQSMRLAAEAALLRIAGEHERAARRFGEAADRGWELSIAKSFDQRIIRQLADTLNYRRLAAEAWRAAALPAEALADIDKALKIIDSFAQPAAFATERERLLALRGTIAK